MAETENGAERPMTLRMLGAILAKIFSDPVAKEIAMGSIEDFFDATGPGRDIMIMERSASSA